MISICMAYYNRHKALKKTIESYEKWYQDLDLEIVIVDDGSDKPPDIHSSLRISIITLPKSKPLNPCVPLNRAVKESIGSRIVITNPEEEHRHPALYDMLWRWDDKTDVIVSPSMDEERGWVAGPKVKYPDPMPENAHYHFCMLMHRDLFPGFDEDYRFGQAYDDNDFIWRLDRAGAKFTCSDVPTYHNSNLHEPLNWKLPLNEELFFTKWPHLKNQ